jgi:hypothetical protein
VPGSRPGRPTERRTERNQTFAHMDPNGRDSAEGRPKILELSAVSRTTLTWDP